MIQLELVEKSESDVLDLAEEIGYGELYDVELTQGAASVQREVSGEQQKFLELVRGLGIRHITKLVIHNGLPSVIEIPGEKHGIAFRQKLKVC